MPGVCPHVRDAQRSDAGTGPKAAAVPDIIRELLDVHWGPGRGSRATVVGDSRIGADAGASQDRRGTGLEKTSQPLELLARLQVVGFVCGRACRGRCVYCVYRILRGREWGVAGAVRVAIHCMHDDRVAGLAESASRIETMATAREQLIELIKAEAVFHGDFTLTSGKKATYYIDLRKLSLDHRAAPLIGQVMLDLIDDIDGVVAVGGLTMGADPIASAIMHQGVARGKIYDAFVVRKEPKDHGRGRQVEGPDLAGKRVVVVEDTSTTGGSPLAAIEALEKVGAEVVAVAVVVDRQAPAKARIEAAGYEYRHAIGLSDLGLDPQ